jgi:hypothetical protein
MEQEKYFLFELIQSLQLLAADCNTQINSFPDFVFVPEEIISTFDESYILFNQVIEAGLVNQNQVQAVTGINDFLDEIYNHKNEYDLWSLEALKSDPTWEKIRMIANAALMSFGKQKDKPDLGWIKFIKGDK